MKYKNIDLLDSRIERIVKSTVKHYYTDWKNCDRIKYIHCKSSNQERDKNLILIVRKCGTWLIHQDNLKEPESWDSKIYGYYKENENAIYYRINLNELSIKKEA